MKHAFTLAILAPSALGFVAPAPGLHACRANLRPLQAEATKSVEDEGKVYYASEVVEEGKTEFSKVFGDQGVPTYKETVQPSVNQGPETYKGLIDGDAFDGGDGQVGCVGDGKNALDTFEVNEVMKGNTDHTLKVKESMVKDSKSRQMNAWGSGVSGYAEELEKKGMKKVDEYGEDKMATRRQQLENWGNQQKLQQEQRAKLGELDRLTGQDGERSGAGWKRGARANYFDNLSKAAEANSGKAWNEYEAPKGGAVKADGTPWPPLKLTGREKPVAVVPVVSRMSRPGTTVVEVKNTVMTFEPYHTIWLGEDTDGFSVSPAEGTLNRRNGDPVPITVSYLSRGPADNRIATLVVETEEDKFLYTVEGRTE